MWTAEPLSVGSGRGGTQPAVGGSRGLKEQAYCLLLSVTVAALKGL